ncbi:hypothetical protein TVAG_033290 [Trichomonas vaginalis G3]|uniref:Uncharacterized protein n=1 Tax=Trichomonas vaginalis (strain ATCC PRA-98 / G3) TaxID=412133 RepID=A2FIZ4_TRIV3|nr:armadillo (ARM) repeat-containing protein family [Trichomonas vaginalis G3]EAX95109.1 hypothetical protein TVAG_033290 [Trichomonas vaginalis G3]KAI5524598.1 armadillo (ARM) repeat-containing protein family [Trichomonas vaginalis G3]|eukprot:XP_001308039.1 hypothetical protein [Trichomonas vaginalis G3]
MDIGLPDPDEIYKYESVLSQFIIQTNEGKVTDELLHQLHSNRHYLMHFPKDRIQVVLESNFIKALFSYDKDYEHINIILDIIASLIYDQSLYFPSLIENGLINLFTQSPSWIEYFVTTGKQLQTISILTIAKLITISFVDYVDQIISHPKFMNLLLILMKKPQQPFDWEIQKYILSIETYYHIILHEPSYINKYYRILYPSLEYSFNSTIDKVKETTPLIIQLLKRFFVEADFIECIGIDTNKLTFILSVITNGNDKEKNSILDLLIEMSSWPQISSLLLKLDFINFCIDFSHNNQEFSNLLIDVVSNMMSHPDLIDHILNIDGFVDYLVDSVLNGSIKVSMSCCLCISWIIYFKDLDYIDKVVSDDVFETLSDYLTENSEKYVKIMLAALERVLNKESMGGRKRFHQLLSDETVYDQIHSYFDSPDEELSFTASNILKMLDAQ